MKPVLPLTAFTLALAAPAFAQEEPGPPPQPPAAARADDSPAAEPAPAPSEADLEIARRALANADIQRLLADRGYASEILHAIDLVSPSLAEDAGAADAVGTLRLFALAALGRGDEAGPIIDDLLRERARDPQFYAVPLVAASALRDRARIVATIEAASANVPGVGWSSLRAMFNRGAMGALLNELRADGQDELRVRLAGALFRIGWPGDGDEETGDAVRWILLKDRLAHDDRAGAAGYAASLRTPVSILSLITGRRYDSLLPPDADRLALLRDALDRQDGETAAALALAPADPRRVLARMRYLRGLGRDEEAIALARPFLRDIRATVAANEQGMWLVNEAGAAMIAAGRDREGLALLRRLAALRIEDNPPLIGPRINHALALWDAGRSAESLDTTLRVNRDGETYANAFGKALIASAIACALARLGRGGEAAPWLARLQESAAINPTALLRARLCLGQADEAAALLVQRLEGDKASGEILMLQDYQPGRAPAQGAGAPSRPPGAARAPGRARRARPGRAPSRAAAAGRILGSVLVSARSFRVRRVVAFAGLIA